MNSWTPPRPQPSGYCRRAVLPIFCALFFLLAYPPPLHAARAPATPERFRALVLPRIEEACLAEAGAANGLQLAPKITLEWKKRALGFKLTYERRIDYDDAGRLSLLEIWRLPRKRLGEFLIQWGNGDPPGWDQLTGEIFGGFIIASRREKTLIVIREGHDPRALWALPPFSFDGVGPMVPPPVEEERPSGVERGLIKVGRNIKQLFSEIVIDELTDIRGVPIKASMHTTIEFNIGDLTPRISLQRRLRMEDDDTFTVVDSLEGELGLLLGYLGSSSETGAFLEAKRRVVIFRGGYDKWYKALFAKPFDPRRLPWNVEKLRRMPPGVRVVFPASTGFYVGEDRVIDEIVENLPLKETFKIGLRGTFFLSMSRDFDNRLEVRFGGRVERVAFAQLRARYDRVTAIDWRRLLGSFIKGRFEHIRGARLFYQREIDLADDQQAADAIVALKQGLKVSGYRLGGAAIGDFLFFLGEVDQRTLDKVITKNLPDFQWDHRVESKYLSHNWYGKGDIKLASVGRSSTAMNDRWKLVSPLTGDSVSGTSGRRHYKKSARFWVNRDRHDIQVHYLSSRGRNEAYPLTDFIEVFVRRKETRTTRRELRSMLKRTGQTLGAEILESSGFPGVLPDRDKFQRFDYRWHLIMRDEALDTLAERVLGASKGIPGSVTRKLSNRHRWRFRSVERAEEKGGDALNAKLAHLVMSALRWNEPVHVLFSHFPDDSYLFNWSIRARGLPNSGGFSGRCSVPEEMRWAWKAWQELADFDDLFEDLDLFE